MVARPAWDIASMHEAWWGTVISSGESSSAWIDVIEVVRSVPTDVVEMRMSWECHVSCEGRAPDASCTTLEVLL